MTDVIAASLPGSSLQRCLSELAAESFIKSQRRLKYLETDRKSGCCKKKNTEVFNEFVKSA